MSVLGELMRPIRALALAAAVALPLSACKKEERASERAPVPASSAAPTPAVAAAPPEQSEAPSAADGRRNLLGSDAYSSVVEAEKALDRAKSDLDGLLGGARSGPGGGATPLATGDPRCANACKAMGSLRRAADAVCRLAGATDARCSHAKGVVDESEKRVAACKCEPEPG
jgi:hypothetical protein